MGGPYSGYRASNYPMYLIRIIGVLSTVCYARRSLCTHATTGDTEGAPLYYFEYVANLVFLFLSSIVNEASNNNAFLFVKLYWE